MGLAANLVKRGSDLVQVKEIETKCCYFVKQIIVDLNPQIIHKITALTLLLIYSGINTHISGQANQTKEKVQRASKKIESGYKKNNEDTVAQGYFDLGESFYQKGELDKSESYLKKSKDLYEKMKDADGIAKSSRALAKVQEELNKNSEAVTNYSTARDNSFKIGDSNSNMLNTNDIRRLSGRNSFQTQDSLIQTNIRLGLSKKDTGEVISGYGTMGDIYQANEKPAGAINAFNNAYNLSRNNPRQAQDYNQRITDLYLGQKDFAKAIETKKVFLGEGFVQNSTKLKAEVTTSLADIYISKKEDSAAIQLLKEAYDLSVKNGHTLEARKSIEKMDSLYQRHGKKDMSLALYKNFLTQLPDVIAKDSSLADNRIVAETEIRIKELETEKALKDDQIRRKNIFTYWLTGSMIVLALFTGIVLIILKKLRTKNKKIALQSLRREMNPHFIFNSLNSINQFIANNNELEANQYLSKFSTLMRRVMENSKEDFVLFSKEIELLKNYLELEKSRFPDKFVFDIKIDDSLFADEQLYVPCMLVQPHLENAIWHGLRYIEDKGFLQLSFNKMGDGMGIIIEDNGIGIAESKKNKTANQKKHSGRGITNTMERIKILNELYHQNIRCEVEDKAAPGRGVKVKITVPHLKHFTA